jgi:hemerythrin-like domain-containing protein
MDILTQLSDEHEELRAALTGIEMAAEARDEAALAARLEAARAALTDALDAHIAMEEAEAFSIIAGALGEGLVAPFYEDHAEIKATRDDVYARLARGASPFEASMRLCALILSHQQREDQMLFPSAREAAFS